MYYFVRVIIYILLIVIYIILLKRFKIKKSIKIVIASSIVIISLIIWLLPFENYFVSFSTPESAFWYSNINTKVYKEVKNNEHVIFIYSDKSSDLLVQDYKRDKNGWKIFSPNIYNAYVTSFGSYIVTVKQLQDCNSQFIMLSYIKDNHESGHPDIIKDKFNSSFSSLHLNKNSEVIYYTIVDHSLANYYITVNGEKINVG